MTEAIVVKDLGKRYQPRDGNRPTSLKGRLFSGFRSQRRDPFWALRHINFSVARGRAVGVVGMNGAGKSSLLRLIGGVGQPDEGSVRTEGRIGALLDIGAGLTEDLTGRENVFLLGVIAGMLRVEVQERFDEIVAFAELQEFIEAPVRTYSTGMRMRLAFAVAIHTEPDVLLIDEVLAVGDQAFQRKCLRRVGEIRASGCTIFLVAHDEAQIRALCDDVILLNRGRLVAYGPMDETLAIYAASIDAKDAGSALPDVARPAGADVELKREVNRFGSGAALIDAVTLLDNRGNIVTAITTGAEFAVRFDFTLTDPADAPIAVVGIYDAQDTACFESNSLLDGLDLGGGGPNGTASLTFDRLDLAPGDYRITVGLFSPDWETVYDYHAEAYAIRVIGTGPTKGYLNPPLRWRRTDESAARMRENG